MKNKILSIIILVSICFIHQLYAKTLVDTKKSALPYYKLPIGRNLIYNAYSESKGTNISSGSKTQIQFRVWHKNQDGSFRIIINRTVFNHYVYNDTIRKEQEPVVTWSYCDLYPDGRILKNITLEDFDPSSYFPPMPTDTLIAKQSWETYDSATQERTHYQIENKNLTDSVLTIRMQKETPFDSIYILSSKSLIYIDLRK